MNKLKDNKPLRYILGIVFFILLCCNLPSLALCSAQDIFRPPNTEVLVSACKRPGARGVPDGEVLFVREVRAGKMYLLDLRTSEKRKLPNDPLLLEKGIFLSSDLVWLEGSTTRPGGPGYHPHYILDLTDGKRYELLDLDTLPRLTGGKFDPKNYSYIQSAQYIYIHHSKNTLVALSSDFHTNPNGRVVYSDSTEELVQLTRNFNMEYKIIDLGLYHAEVSSPTNKYVVRNDGIYFSGTNFSVVNREYTGGRFMGGYFKSWYYDESAVVVQGAGYYLFSFPGVSSIFYIPSPILKLNLP
ncbi:MAG: hypothetical protein KF758_13945 [Anaerolineales bacterium]|nr:hypothetical protein [Anaerolineales bacterium]MBX3038008.1 hypothetical protein [Anaerolineales bacterium]